MEEQLILFDTSKLAKEKGFNIKTLNGYDKDGILLKWDGNYPTDFNNNGYGDFNCPTQSLLQKWLRETHNIRVFITQSSAGGFKYEIYTWENPNNIGKWDRSFNATSSLSYEEALEQGLQAALKLIQ